MQEPKQSHHKTSILTVTCDRLMMSSSGPNMNLLIKRGALGDKISADGGDSSVEVRSVCSESLRVVTFPCSLLSDTVIFALITAANEERDYSIIRDKDALCVRR